MRGEVERNCFEFVKKNLNRENYYGMSHEDYKIIEDALNTASENSNLSVFPDFIYSCGCIEHFQVTSSYENRKGSTILRENAEIEHEFDRMTDGLVKEMPNDHIALISVETPIYAHDGHSYEKFVKSFKRNFENHIKRLKEYKGNKETTIFMIEYSDSALCMRMKYPDDLKQGISYGDLLSSRKKAYRVSRDTELLQYLYDKREFVKYIVFVNRDEYLGMVIDVINAENALEVAKISYNKYIFSCITKFSSQMGIGSVIPNNKGLEENEQTE